jgi:hypothetical protein
MVIGLIIGFILGIGATLFAMNNIPVFKRQFKEWANKL